MPWRVRAAAAATYTLSAQALEEEIMSTIGPDDERLESIYERLEELDPTTFEVRAPSRRIGHAACSH